MITNEISKKRREAENALAEIRKKETLRKKAESEEALRKEDVIKKFDIIMHSNKTPAEKQEALGRLFKKKKK
jgi:hypothetical protein